MKGVLWKWLLFLFVCFCFCFCFFSEDISVGICFNKTPGGLNQWHNRQGSGGRVPPRDFWPGNFCWPTGKREGKKGKCSRKEGKSNKGKWKIENGRRKKSYKMREMKRGLSPPPFSLFKTTEICFGSTKMGIFYREKSISRWEENQE